MKLNPKKCSFGMEEGKFLGYIVTSEGIRANPEKAKAVMDMPSLKTLKQMQSLSGKLAALNRFLSKWTEAAEAAFLEMKKLVSELPTLTTPKKGETLMMYLAATNEAVSAVLLTERDGRQMPIHYVITDSLIRQVLNNSGALGRLAKWAVELGAYAITYVPRVAVKDQVLADFLADTLTKINATPEVASNPKVEDIPESSNARENLTTGSRAWRLYTDRASNNKGSRAGLILVALDDVEYSYAIRLNFSNYEAKGERMIKYREKILELAGAFNRFRITHIPRANNRKADALSKLAAFQFDHLSKEVLVEVLNERSVEA
ncbi:reverse transcriptase domain-containing protein [Tanacetum coccineum]